MNILIVTGSRALVGSERETEARAILSALVASAPKGTTIVSGDAAGPDAWALFEAARHNLASRWWALDGWIYAGREPDIEWAAGIECDRTARSWPLVRNRLMVRSCARRARTEGDLVSMLALEAAWSITRGTAHTIGIARDCGLAVTHVVFRRAS